MVLQTVARPLIGTDTCDGLRQTLGPGRPPGAGRWGVTQHGYHLIETISSFPIGRGISTSPKSEQTGPHCLITVAGPADSWYMDSQGNGGQDFSGKSFLHLLIIDLRVRGGPGKQGALSKVVGLGI